LPRASTDWKRGSTDVRAHRLVALAAVAMAWAVAASAAEPGLRVSGSAVARSDAVVQRNGRFELQATLSNAAPASTVTVQHDRRFELTALLTATAQACYDDTIFRDAFDGTGL
jgi:hypothetical protein